MKVELLKQPSVCVQLNTQLQKEQKKRREMFIVMLTCLALRGHSEIEGNLMQLLLLRTSEYPELKHYMNDGKYFSHDIINELVYMMGMFVLKSILSDIKKSGKFSRIADEASDVGHKERFCISIRWVDSDFVID